MTAAQEEEISKIEAGLNEAQHDLRETLIEASAKAESLEGLLRPDVLIERHPIEAMCVAGALGFVIGSKLNRSAVGPAMIVSLLGFAISKRVSNNRSADDGRAKTSK
jgi:hypothetical protein